MRELQIEPFKIFPNKTLCQLIRYRRNDAAWATDRTVKIEQSDTVEQAGETVAVATVDKKSNVDSSAGDDQTEPSPPKVEDSESLKNVIPTPYDESIAKDLLQCFGIGPGKVKAGGFAWEALTVLNRTGVAALLEKSRLLEQGTDTSASVL